MINREKYSYIRDFHKGFAAAIDKEKKSWTFIDKTGKDLWKPFFKRSLQSKTINNKTINLLILPNNKYSVTIPQYHKRFDFAFKTQAEKIYSMLIMKETLGS